MDNLKTVPSPLSGPRRKLIDNFISSIDRFNSSDVGDATAHFTVLMNRDGMCSVCWDTTDNLLSATALVGIAMGAIHDTKVL